MPFAFYYNPYLAITLRHYDTATYYDHLIDMHELLTSNKMLLRAPEDEGTPRGVRFVHTLRTLATRAELADFRRIRAMLGSDAHFRAFHEGAPTSSRLLHASVRERLGRYAELVPAGAPAGARTSCATGRGCPQAHRQGTGVTTHADCNTIRRPSGSARRDVVPLGPAIRPVEGGATVCGERTD